MAKLTFDAELKGTNAVVVPVYCEVQPPYVGGEKALIRIAVPAQYITKNPPRNPCNLSGTNGAFTISMQGVYWRHFPTSSKSNFGQEVIELLQVERLTIRHSWRNATKEICFHLVPISYLRSESGSISFGGVSDRKELFVLDLPDLGATRFVVEWVTIHHRDAEIPGATVIAGFSAVVSLPSEGSIDANKRVAQFKSSLEILSILFRQAVSLHGWTYTDDSQTVSTWVDAFEPNVTPSARKDRGDFVASPQTFEECATNLAQAYGKADAKTRSLARHLLVAVNPHINSRTNDHFLSMFSALERVVEYVYKRDKTPRNPAATDEAITRLLNKSKEPTIADGGDNTMEILARLDGLIRIVVNRPSFRDKFEAFLRAYPAMNHYRADLWPVLGSDKKRGLREIRNALAHGHNSFVSVDVVAVAEWHLAILLERFIFVLLGITLPDGIVPRSPLLQVGGRGWYKRDWWTPLQSKPDQLI